MNDAFERAICCHCGDILPEGPHLCPVRYPELYQAQVAMKSELTQEDRAFLKGVLIRW